jgi:ribonuclease BN (tRNA processing enzyme)
MSRVGVDAGAINAVFLTHFHGDHTLGLPTFILHRIFVDPRPITFIGPAGLEERLEALWEVSWGADWTRVMRPKFKVTYKVAEAKGRAAGYRYGLRASSSPTPEIPSPRLRWTPWSKALTSPSSRQPGLETSSVT